ncbi:MAG: CoB--CoM heterodisulfide reductase iron-sulfur subunit B family protein [Planctomycetota bacterium]|jgi:heterodisulfide reductase subunit B
MELSYYPGCTLKSTAINYERTALALLSLFDIKTVELSDWVCCGSVFSLVSDNLMYQLAPVRVLIRAKETGNKRLLTLCDMCYNTLKRASLFVENDEEKRNKINEFMTYEQTEYHGGEVEVIHMLSLLDEMDPKEIKKQVKKKITNLKVACYYACQLLRPKEIAIDSSEEPTIMERLFEAAGCETVYFPFKTECCGSYQIVNQKEIVMDRTKKIVTSAIKNGAEIMVLSCPLCNYNIDAVQKDLKEQQGDFETIPVLYFSQLLALILGIDPSLNDFSLHHIDPRGILEEKELL